jgi:ribosomal-protein-serine acetyltransferase
MTLSATRHIRRIGPDIELRPLEESDATVLYMLVDRNRDYLRRWQNWPDSIRSSHDMAALIRRSQEKSQQDNGFDLSIWYRGRAAGKIGLVYINWAERQSEIGYWLAAEFQGHGLVTRACRVVLDTAFTELGLRSIHIRCAAGNKRSRAIPERLGFTFGGVMKHRIMLHGRLHEEVLYTMSSSDWQARMIYHITSWVEWEAAQAAGQYRAPSLETQGFIHLSREGQVVPVADALYRGQQGLALLCVDPSRLRAELKYEPPDGTAPAVDDQTSLFPHLYGPLNLDAVLRVLDFPAGDDGRFSLPADLRA